MILTTVYKQAQHLHSVPILCTYTRYNADSADLIRMCVKGGGGGGSRVGVSEVQVTLSSLLMWITVIATLLTA